MKYPNSKEQRAVAQVRELGGDATEELDAFFEARRERTFLNAEVDRLFEEMVRKGERAFFEPLKRAA